MTEAMLKAILTASETSLKDGFAELPGGRTLTLYVAHDGVSMSVGKVASLRVNDEILEARSNKGELYVLNLSDVFAASVSGSQEAGKGRKAGFLG